MAKANVPDVQGVFIKRLRRRMQFYKKKKKKIERIWLDCFIDAFWVQFERSTPDNPYRRHYQK